MKKHLYFKFDDGSVWKVATEIVAQHRSTYCAWVDGITFKEAYEEDTIPLFEADDFEIEDYAKNKMDWDELQATEIGKAKVNYAEEFYNAKTWVSDLEYK